MSELAEFFHAKRTIAAFRMDRRVIEKNAVAAGFELLLNDEFLVGSPVRGVHASGLIFAAVPRGQSVSRSVLLTPGRRRSMKFLAKRFRPIAIKRVQLYNRSSA